MGKSKAIPFRSKRVVDDDFEYVGSPTSPRFRGPVRAPEVTPRTPNQELLLEKLKRIDPAIVIATGSAGSGKSHIATVVGLRKLYDGHVKKIIITRPAVTVDEDHGFLPGTIQDKMAPFMRPIYDSMYTVYSPKQVQQLIDEQIIEICPLAYCRGRTFNDAWVICDEVNNTTPNQLLLLMTRLGENSKMVLTGDEMQSDLRGPNGLADILRRIGPDGVTGEIEVVRFGSNDVVRHPVIKTVLRLYE